MTGSLPAATLHADVSAQSWEEPVDVFGRRFVLLIEGPVPPGRFEIRIWEGRRGSVGGQYLRAPIRGRDAEEARERALEVLHNYVGLDRFRTLVEEVTREVTPGAQVDVAEDARNVVIRLEGRYTLGVPLAMPRDRVLDPAADQGALQTLVRAHLRAHAQAR